MDRCPNCRARLDDAAETCRRCGMELGLLRAIERAADDWLRCGIMNMMRDESDLARKAFCRALTLRRDPLTESLLGLLSHESTAVAPSPIVSTPLPSSSTVVAGLDDDEEEGEPIADQVERIQGGRLRAFYRRFFHRR
ncbi:MAG: hypothetical protein K9L82_01580 [Chromatiaceae bacterium]|nr:hypothetical protein [Chromatiaceae bacterium]MCF7995647.1 hypothetical protein [Chromatiaceae bacterium]MCF8003696.1 hypothetical protein [Chromatiaceae bacterium]MCF8016777.1 hypothetical protein [Chromatiaceae bacterium]